MSAPVQEAAQALAPLLSNGADVAARELAGQAGSAFARAALQLISKLRSSLKSTEPDQAEIEDALRTGLAESKIADTEVMALVTTFRAGRDQWNVKAGRDVNIGNVNRIEGDFHA